LSDEELAVQLGPALGAAWHELHPRVANIQRAVARLQPENLRDRGGFSRRVIRLQLELGEA
jgi:hypothetical protein